MADIYTQITHDVLDVNSLISTFDQLSRVPMHMRSLMKEVILAPNHSLPVARERIRSSIVDNQGYATTWMQLKGLDKSIIQYLADGGTEPYSSNARQSYADGLSIKNVSVATVQNAICRLTRQNHLTKNAHGDYVVSEPNFLIWAKEQQ